jgi:hypothetical protein
MLNVLSSLNRLSEAQQVSMDNSIIQTSGSLFRAEWQMEEWKRNVMVHIRW